MPSNFRALTTAGSNESYVRTVQCSELQIYRLSSAARTTALHIGAYRQLGPSHAQPLTRGND